MIPRRILLALALASAALAGFAYYRDADRVAVVVATRAIQSETALSSDDLALVDLPPDAVPADALHDRQAAVGRTVRAPLAAGQLVLASLFDAPPGFRSGIRPPAGWRAIALPVSPETALGGAIVPGMRVDVIAIPLRVGPAEEAPIERIASGILVVDVRSESGGVFVEPGTERGAIGSGRLGSVILAIPAEDDIRFAFFIATSTFVLLASE